jgi:dethiobiotin synthetase/adenosylmethionine--8-amino-7-oxononanoate aminotransferase
MDISRSQPTPIPIIFDEVAAGLYRVGVSSCREIIQSDPDIAAYAKLLTGGLVPMSVTLTTEEVFETFLGDSKGEALLHGHSYTAHPVGCVSSIHALDTYAELFESDDGVDYKKAYFDPEVVAELSRLPLVQESMSLGTVVAVTMEPDSSGGSGYTAAGRSKPVVKHLLENGVYCRPLGNVVYIMVSPLTSREECARLCNLLTDAILALDEK